MSAVALAPPNPGTPCLRVTQLDAHDLDEYLVQLLIRQQLDKCLQYSFPKYLENIKPELQTALYGTLLYFTVGKVHQSVGQKLFGVMLANADNLAPAPRKKILCLIGLELFIYWWKAKYNDVPPAFIFSSPKLSKTLDILIALTKFLEICNFLMFLRRGEFSRALLRILGLRLVFDHPNPVQSAISYTIISREILWQGFAESTLYFLTFINIPSMKKFFQQKLKAYQEPVSHDLKTCGICGEWPNQPHETNCGHAFCYYCAFNAASTKSQCPTCNVEIEKVLGLKIVNEIVT